MWPSYSSGCVDGSIRLVGEQDTAEGNVEVCLDGVWGSVCHHGWSSLDAVVVCEQLGFQGTSMYKC